MNNLQLAKERDSRNVCIVCESAEPPRKRGLCKTCYSRFRNSRIRLNAKEAAVFETRFIAVGYLLPAAAGRKQNPGCDPFTDIADAVRENQPDYVPIPDPDPSPPNKRPHFTRPRITKPTEQ